MANNEFYKGRRKRKNVMLLVFALLAIFFSTLIVLFYSMQKYAVITKDSVEIRIGENGEVPVIGENTPENRNFETTQAELSIVMPDFTEQQQISNTRLNGMRAIFIPAEELTASKVEECCSRLSTGNSLVFEMKPKSGFLAWISNCRVANAYGLNYESEKTKSIQTYIDYCKERDVWLVAQISCCLDARFAQNSGSISIKNANGMDYTDSEGVWLDPYSTILREYIVDLVNELYEMGFDEVVLADVRHPAVPEGVSISYTRDMSASVSPEHAVGSFAVSVAEALEGHPGVLSIYTYSLTSLVKADPYIGDSAPLFFKLFDRVYYNTDRYTFSFNMQDITHSITTEAAASRFVPVVINYLPDNAPQISWVLVDREEPEN